MQRPSIITKCYMIKYKPGTLLRYHVTRENVYVEYIIILSYFTKNKEKYIEYYTVSNSGFKAVEVDLVDTFYSAGLWVKVLHEL